MSKKTTLILLTLLLVFLCLAGLFIGAEYIPFKDVLNSLLNQKTASIYSFVILDIRLPRVITAILSGFGLSIAGLMMQTYFRNSLAGPSILGITSGASLGVAIVTMTSAFIGVNFLEGYSLALASIAGSIFVLFLVLVLASRVGNGPILLIIGIILASFIGAIVTILQFFTDAENIQKYILWTMGSTSSTTLSDVFILAIIVIVGVAISFTLIKPLNALLIGEEYATSMGVNIKIARFLIILSTGIITGGITAFCGPIAFIGLVIPNLVKLKTKTLNHSYIIPLCGLVGAIVMLLADAISQAPILKVQLPINAITSLIAAPIIIVILLNKTSK